MRYLLTLVLLATICGGMLHADEIDALRSIVSKSQDLSAQRDAIQELRKLGRPALPALRELLAHPEPPVRVLVIAALGELSSPQSDPQRHAAWPAVPEMIRLLEDPDIRVRRSAAYSLGWFWGVPGEGPRRDKIAKSAVPKLTKCLSDPDPKLRQYSALLLWRLADVAWEAVPALVAALEDKEGAASYARKILLFLGPPERGYTARQLQAVLAAQPAAPDVAKSAERWQGADNSEAEANLGLSRFVALLYLGRKAADPEVKAAAPLLLKLAAETHPAVRFHALSTSAKLGVTKESPLPILEAALLADDPNVTFWAAHALVELRGAEAHHAVEILAATIAERELVFSAKGPTPGQRIAELRAQVAVEALHRLGIRLPETRRR